MMSRRYPMMMGTGGSLLLLKQGKRIIFYLILVGGTALFCIFAEVRIEE